MEKEMFIETITPLQAEAYLGKNSFNRRIKPEVVDGYMRDMQNGKWALNGDAIRFDKNGLLLDGQHRLLACIKSGVPFTTYVITGLDTDVFDTIDNGCKRSSGDVFKIRGVANYSNTSAIVRRHLLLKRNLVAVDKKDSGSGKSFHISNRELYDVYCADALFYDEAFLFSQHCYRHIKILSVSNIGGIYCYLINDKHHNKDVVEDFFEQLHDIRPSRLNAVRSLRRILTTDMISVKHIEAKRKQKLIVKAWNYFINGVDVKYFAYQESDNDKWFC